MTIFTNCIDCGKSGAQVKWIGARGLCINCIDKEIMKDNLDKFTGINPINHPPHYQSDKGIEAIDIIEAFSLDFCLGNVIKYVLRAGKKGDRKEDLEKAAWYLKRAIEKDDGNK